jgi:hypothetical protein
MDLLLTLQQDLTDKLNSEAAFFYNAAVSLRGEVISKEIERRMPHLTAKNGRKGCGILVRMPAIRGIQPNVAAPQGEVLAAIDVVENPEINFNPGGTQLTAEEIARAVRTTLHQFAIEGKILLYQDEKAIEPLPGLEKEYAGCLGYRVLLRGRMSELPVTKCLLPTISAPEQTVTLSTTEGGVSIYYTTDGSFPGAVNLATATPPGTALLYTAPFTVSSGTVVRWASYSAGHQGSDVGQATII